MALTNRVGKEALSHYGLDPDPNSKADPGEAEGRRAASTGVEVEVEFRPDAEVEEGLHL